jgi:hypothetical protein
MQTSMLAFASDLHDEGVGTVLDNVQNRAGVNGLTMAVAYHDARDVFPHNPVRKVRYLEGGAVFFPLMLLATGIYSPASASSPARGTLSASCARPPASGECM